MTDKGGCTPVCDGISVENHGDISIMHFSRRPLFTTTDLSQRNKIITCLDHLVEDPSIKVIIIEGAPDKQGTPEYFDFMKTAAAADDKFIFKMMNMFNQVILKIVRAPKAVMYVDSGAVLSQFLHMGLACDYRLVADNTVFHKAYISQGMAPKGGGAYFLRRMVGPAQAFSLLIDDRAMTAHQALELGLVNETAPPEELLETAMNRARDLAAIPATTIAGIKHLLHYPLSELEDYLEHENHELYRAFTRVRAQHHPGV